MDTELSPVAKQLVMNCSGQLAEHSMILVSYMSSHVDEDTIRTCFINMKNDKYGRIVALLSSVQTTGQLCAFYDTLVKLKFVDMAKQFEPFIPTERVKNGPNYMIQCPHCTKHYINDPNILVRLEALRENDELKGFVGREHEKYQRETLCNVIKLMAPVWDEIFPHMVRVFKLSKSDMQVITQEKSTDGRVMKFIINDLGNVRSRVALWYDVLRIFDSDIIPPAMI
jgi:hypothetical protein